MKQTVFHVPSRVEGFEVRRKYLRRRRARMCLALKFMLLALPVVFWSVVFTVAAGVKAMRRVVESIPDAAQVAIALAGPLLVVLLATTLRHVERRADEGLTPSRLTFACVAALFFFTVLKALSLS